LKSSVVKKTKGATLKQKSQRQNEMKHKNRELSQWRNMSCQG